jgi:autotransporter-associated beta strand protein
VNVSSGTLTVGPSAQLFESGIYGATSVVTVSDGGVLQFTAANPFNQSAPGALGALYLDPSYLVLSGGAIQYTSFYGNSPAAYGASDNSSRDFTTAGSGGTVTVTNPGVTWTLGVYSPASASDIDVIVNGGGLFVSGAGNLDIRKAISGAGGVTMDGTGTLILGPAVTAATGENNNYSGDTTINNGTLQLRDAYGATQTVIPYGPGAGNVIVNSPGVLDLNGRSITINGLSGNGTVTSSVYGATCTVGANNQTSTFSGLIQDGYGMIALGKTGAGSLTLTGTNAYSGPTTISEGVLQAVDGVGLPSSSNLVFSGSLATNGYGAVFQSSGSFTRGLGANSDQVQWTGDGGFAAAGGNLTVNINGPDPLVWNNTVFNNGTYGFVPDGGVLTFGSSTAANQVDFQNDIDLNGETRQVDVAAGLGGDSALFSGNISDGLSNGLGDLLKTGAGTLILSGTNTYDGGTTVSNGTLIVDNAYSLRDGSNLTVGAGAAAIFASAAASPAAASPAVAAVPEPGTVMLLISALGSLVRLVLYRRRANSQGRTCRRRTVPCRSPKDGREALS